jgi:hypothetical protein
VERRRCGVVLNGVKLSKPRCSSAKECIELILKDYRREVERLKGPRCSLCIQHSRRAVDEVSGAGGLRRRVGEEVSAACQG